MRLLSIAIGAFLLLSSCKSDGGKGVVLEARLEQFIPGDTVILFGARLDEIQS